MSPCVASGERSVGRTHTATTGGASCRRRTRARPGTLRCSTRTSSSLPPWSGCSPSRTWSTALRRCLLHPSGHQTAGGGVYSESCTGGPFPQTLIGFHCRWVSLTLGALRAHGDRLGLGVVLASGTRVVGDALVEHLVLAGLVRGPERRRRVRQRCAARAHAALVDIGQLGTQQVARLIVEEHLPPVACVDESKGAQTSSSRLSLSLSLSLARSLFRSLALSLSLSRARSRSRSRSRWCCCCFGWLSLWYVAALYARQVGMGGAGRWWDGWIYQRCPRPLYG